MLIPMFIDAHCHIDALEERTGEKFEDLLARMETPPEAFIHNATSIDSFEYGRIVSETFANVYATYGIHPEYVECFDEARLLLPDYWAHERCVACGEFGLDYHYGADLRDEQIRVFEIQLEDALQTGKPLVLHLREAEEDSVAILKNANLGDTKIHVHCFTSNRSYAEKLLSISDGIHIGFTGILTFKSAEYIREAASIVPLNKLLLETDSPFMAPVPYRGEPSHGGMIPHIAEKLSEIKNVPLEELYRQIRENTKNVYGV